MFPTGIRGKRTTKRGRIGCIGQYSGGDSNSGSNSNTGSDSDTDTVIDTGPDNPSGI